MYKKLTNRKIKITVIFVLFLLSLNPVRSQSKETFVTYDLDKQEFESTLPFDEVFKIKFKSEKSIKGLIIKYKIDKSGPIDALKRKYYFQKNADKDGYMIKEIKDVSAEDFSIGGVGPLHPNVPYRFEFYAYEKISLTDNAVNSLKADVKKFINKIYIDTEIVPDPEIIEEQFTKVLQKHVDGLYNKELTQATVQEIFSDDLAYYKDSISIVKKEIDEDIGNYKSDAGLISPSDFGASFCKLIEGLDSKNLSNPGLLDEPLNLLIEGYNNVTLKDMITFYKLNCNRDFDYSASIIKGQTKYTNKFELQGLPKGQLYQNYESLELLRSSLILIKKLKRKSDKKPYFDQTTTDILIGRLKEMIDSSKNISENRTKISELNAEVPDILVNKYSQTVLKTDYRAYSDVESNATPYINLDIGLLYATELQDVFALQTVNFHLEPVNRNAVFSELEGWNKFFKQACLQIGLAQRLGPTDDTYHTFLTGDFGTPYIGLGFRVNRIVRVGVGMIVYEKENINPVITDRTTKGSLSFNITINNALSAALGLLGNIFTVAN